MAITTPAHASATLVLLTMKKYESGVASTASTGRLTIETVLTAVVRRVVGVVSQVVALGCNCDSENVKKENE